MDEQRLNEEEQAALFDALFPDGFAGPDVMTEIAPGGWSASPLVACFHPSVEQVWREAVAMHHNVASLVCRGAPPRPVPTLDGIRQSFVPTPVAPEREACELVAACVWDIFSDNHDVISADGRRVDLGSFRGTAGFIADYLNAKLGSSGYDYMDFCMGTIWLRGRADLSDVYRMVFSRLKREGCDWRYSFPRLGVVDLRPLRDEQAATDGSPEWATYSPSASFERQERDAAREAEVDDLRRSLDDAYRREVEAARYRPPPPIIEAYRAVFGCHPTGWPPEFEGEP